MNQPAAPRACPACTASVVNRFLRLRQMPVDSLANRDSLEEARAARRGDIDLRFCASCGMIFNGAFRAEIEPDLLHSSNLSFSPVFQSYATSLARRLIADYDLGEKEVIQIACGDGDLLGELCDERNRRRRVAFVEASTPTAGLSGSADFLCFRHVLEHLADPRKFLVAVRRCLEDRDGALYCEVSNAQHLLGSPFAWDLTYPRASYFTEPSLRYLFRSCGFQITRIEPAFGGQFLGVEARVCSSRGPLPDHRGIRAMATLTRDFETRFRENVHRWSRVIEYASVEDYRILLWGAGAKAATFLNLVPGAERIIAVVDINPRKKNSYIPGTGHLIIAPETLAEHEPDLILALNPQYEREIGQHLLDLRLKLPVMLHPQLPLPGGAVASRCARSLNTTIRDQNRYADDAAF